MLISYYVLDSGIVICERDYNFHRSKGKSRGYERINKIVLINDNLYTHNNNEVCDKESVIGLMISNWINQTKRGVYFSKPLCVHSVFNLD